MSKIKLVEVGMRDGLQNESRQLAIGQLYRFANKLIECGHVYIEAGAFVSPKWVPQMADSKKLIGKILKAQDSGKISKKIHFSALTPNMYGLEEAMSVGLKEVAVFGAASETFSKKNINCTIEESLEKFKEVCSVAKKRKVKVRGYISTAFGCPYEGKISKKKVLDLIEAYLDMGIYEVSIGDTIGVATPKQVRDLLQSVTPLKKVSKLAMHFHDTRGTALANISASLDFGIKTFDTSLGGLGGCPYAPGSAGNVATEDVVYLLHGMGYKTGLSLGKLVETTKWISKQLDKQLPSKVSLSNTKSCLYF